MIIEGDKQLLFVEFKKIPLPDSYETGDDVSVLQVLDKEMIVKKFMESILFVSYHARDVASHTVSLLVWRMRMVICGS